MEYGITHNQQEYRDLLINVILSRLSGSSVLAVEDVENIEMSINFILNKCEAGSLIERYQQGRQVLQEQVEATKVLYEKILIQYKSYEIEALKGSITGFKDFFKQYDLNFGAHLVPGVWLDYQLAEPVDEQLYQGIDFVWHYLTNFYCEMQFLNSISEAVILTTLEEYSHDLGIDYRVDVNNVYEVIFNQVFTHIFLSKSVTSNTSLVLSENEASYLLAHKEEIYPTLSQIDFIKENRYYRHSLKKLQTKLNHITNVADLSGLLLIKKEPQDKIIFAAPLSALAYTQLTAAIESGMSLKTVAQKIASPFDLIALCEDRVLTEDEFSKVVAYLDLTVFIAFLLWVKSEQHNEWLKINDILKAKDKTILPLKQRLSQMTAAEITYVNQALATIKVVGNDFF